MAINVKANLAIVSIFSLSDYENMNKGDIITQIFMAEVQAAIKEKGLEEKEVADMAFKGMAHPNQTYYKIKKGKRSLHLRDAFNLIDALGLRFPDFMWNIEKIYKENNLPNRPQKPASAAS